MKHLIPPLFAVLVIVNGWGEEWIYAAGLSMGNCNALASEIQAELAEGERAVCKNVLFPASRSPAHAVGAADPPRKRLDAFPDFTFK